MRLLATLTLVAASLCAAPPSYAAGFDGSWSLLVVTEKGTCDSAYRYPLRISHGVVGHAEGASSSFSIKGSVAGNGAVSVRVSRGDKSASGSGRLSGAAGTGKWRTADNGCSGYWQAERRG